MKLNRFLIALLLFGFLLSLIACDEFWELPSNSKDDQEEYCELDSYCTYDHIDSNVVYECMEITIPSMCNGENESLDEYIDCALNCADIYIEQQPPDPPDSEECSDYFDCIKHCSCMDPWAQD